MHRDTIIDVSKLRITGCFETAHDYQVDTIVEDGIKYAGKIVMNTQMKNQIRVDFNSDRKSWTYPYESDRFKNGRYHCFVIRVYYDDLPPESFMGPRFRLLSARRNDAKEVVYPPLCETGTPSYQIDLPEIKSIDDPIIFPPCGMSKPGKRPLLI
jgi:hypothetical protein